MRLDRIPCRQQGTARRGETWSDMCFRSITVAAGWRNGYRQGLKWIQGDQVRVRLRKAWNQAITVGLKRRGLTGEMFRKNVRKAWNHAITVGLKRRGLTGEMFRKNGMGALRGKSGVFSLNDTCNNIRDRARFVVAVVNYYCGGG